MNPGDKPKGFFHIRFNGKRGQQQDFGNGGQQWTFAAGGIVKLRA